MTPSPLSLPKPKLHLILIFLITALIFSATLSHDFVWDDHSFIVDWDQTRHFDLEQIVTGALPEFHTGVYRPVRNIFYPISFQLWHLNPTGYHFQAILFHFIAAAFTYGIAYQLSGKSHLALLTSLIFATHPIQVESIAWVTASFDVTSFIFALASFYLYLLAGKSRPNYHTYSLLLAVAAFFSNEISFVLPLLIIAHRFVVKHQSLSTSIKDSKGFLVAAAFCWTIRWLFIGQASRLTLPLADPLDRFWLSLQLATRYLSQLILPLHLDINHHFSQNTPGLFFLDAGDQLRTFDFSLFEPAVLLAIFTFTLATAATIYFYKHQPLLSFALIWILLALLPVLQIFPQPIIFAERYAYLAAFGFALASALILSKLHKLFPDKLYIIVVTALLVGYSAKTYQRTLVWHNNYSLWHQAYQNHPNSPSVLNSYGLALAGQGDYDTAYQLLNRSVELNPQVEVYVRNLINLYLSQDQFDQAIAQYQQLAKQHHGPNLIDLRIGEAYQLKGDYQTAMDYYQQAKLKHPDNQEIHQAIINLQAQLSTPQP